MSLRTGRKWSISKRCQHYLSHDRQRLQWEWSQQFSHWKFIHGEKAQPGSPADGSTFPVRFTGMTSEPVWWCYFCRWLCVLFCAGLPRRVILLHLHIYRHSSWLPAQGFSGWFLVAINKLPMWCYYLLRVIYSFSQKLPPGGNRSAWDFSVPFSVDASVGLTQCILAGLLWAPNLMKLCCLSNHEGAVFTNLSGGPTSGALHNAC